MKHSRTLLVGACLAGMASPASANGIGIQGGLEFFVLPSVAPNAFAWDRDGNEIDLTPDIPLLRAWSGGLSIPLGTAAGKQVSFGLEGFFANSNLNSTQELAVFDIGGFAWNGIWASESSLEAQTTLIGLGSSAILASAGTEAEAVFASWGQILDNVASVLALGALPNITLNVTSTPATSAVAYAARISELGGRIAIAFIGPTGVGQGPIAITQSDSVRALGGNATIAVDSVGPGGGIVSLFGGFAYRSINRDLTTGVNLQLDYFSDSSLISQQIWDFEVHEHLTSRYIGGVVGLGFSTSSSRALSLDVSASFAPFHLAASYSGYESNRIYSQESGPGVDTIYLTDTLIDAASRFAFEGAGATTLSVNFDSGVRLSVGGSVRYLSAMATIMRESQATASISPTNNQVTNAGTTGPLASLSFTSMLSFGVNIGLSVSIGGP